MATRNGATFLKEQLNSILMQLNAEDELVISDDCSSDNTVKIIQSYNDPRIKLLQQHHSVGISKNFEISLTASQGQYIFLADQDDVWHASKKTTMLHYLQKYDLVISDCLIVDEFLKPRHHSFHSLNRSGKGFLKNLFKNSYMGCCMAFHRDLMKRALPFPADIPMYDQWIGMVGELYFKVHFANEVLVYHRRHTSNATTTGRSTKLSFSRRFTDRYKIIKNIFLHQSYAE
jgi:glycosyltransferase involved in cell wall biosynthesis